MFVLWLACADRCVYQLWFLFTNSTFLKKKNTCSIHRFKSIGRIQFLELFNDAKWLQSEFFMCDISVLMVNPSSSEISHLQGGWSCNYAHLFINFRFLKTTSNVLKTILEFIQFSSHNGFVLETSSAALLTKLHSENRDIRTKQDLNYVLQLRLLEILAWMSPRWKGSYSWSLHKFSLTFKDQVHICGCTHITLCLKQWYFLLISMENGHVQNKSIELLNAPIFKKNTLRIAVSKFKLWMLVVHILRQIITYSITYVSIYYKLVNLG